MIQVESLERGQQLRVEYEKLADRLPSKIVKLLRHDSFGIWMGGYKIVDGGIALVLELSDGSTSWFFENELSEIIEE